MTATLDVAGGVYAFTMARGGATTQSGSIYHVISRFVAKEWFIESAVERQMYIFLLGMAMAPTDWRCFSYAVMSSHIHLGLLAGRDPLVSWLRPMHTRFAQWINWRRDRIGAVFVRGPNVHDIQVAGTGRLINYIHNNPVRARVVAEPGETDWTSHRAYVGRARRPDWLHVELGLQLGGFSSSADFEAWMAQTRVGRKELETFHSVQPSRRGRPTRGLPLPCPDRGRRDTDVIAAVSNP